MNQTQLTEKIYSLIEKAWKANAAHMMPSEEVLKTQAAAWAQELTEIEFTGMSEEEYDWLFKLCRAEWSKKVTTNPIPSLDFFRAKRFDQGVREQMGRMRQQSEEKAKRIAPVDKQSVTSIDLMLMEDDLVKFLTLFELDRREVAKVRAMNFLAQAKRFAESDKRSYVTDMLRKYEISGEAKAFLFAQHGGDF